MQILCTGTSGFVGAHLAKHLTDKGHNVIPVIRNKEKIGLQGNVLHINSIDSVTNWGNLINGCEIVIHCAARAHIMKDTSLDPLNEYLEVNTKGTINLARASANAGVKRFIYISSIKVNGESTPNNQLFSPDDIPYPLDDYGVSKAAAEEELLALSKETKMEVVIIRPPLIYGPGVKANFRLLLKLSNYSIPMPFGLIDKNKRSLISIYNLMDFIDICTTHEKAANEIFLVSDDEDVSTAQLFKTLCNAQKKMGLTLPIPVAMFKLMGRLLGKQDMVERLCGSLQVDISKAKKLLGWQPKFTLKEGIKMTIEEGPTNDS